SRLKSGRAPQCLGARKHFVMRETLIKREKVVSEHPGAYSHRAAMASLVNGNEHGQRLHKMRRDCQKPLALSQTLAHKAGLAVLKIAKPAVNEPRRPAGRPTAYVTLIEHQNPQPARRRIARNARAVDARADNGDIKRSA